jgi:hypothetical protein
MIACALPALPATARADVDSERDDVGSEYDAEAQEDGDDEAPSVGTMDLEALKYQAAKEQHRTAGWVLGIVLPVGLLTATVGGYLWWSNICIMGCSDSRRANMEIGMGLAIAGGVVALGSALFGALLLSEANHQLKDLGRLEVSVAPTPGGLSAGARWSF